MKKTLILSLFLSFIFYAKGQSTIKIANSFFDDENYIVALNHYKKIYNKDSSNRNEINYKMGVCYLNCNSNPELALKYLLEAENNKTDDYMFYFELGWAYLNKQKFDKALEAFNKSKTMAKNNTQFVALIDLKITHTKNAKKYYKNPINISFKNLGKDINSPMDELTPIISAEDETLFFTSNQKFDREYNIYTFDVFYTMLSKKSYSKKRALTNVNSIEDEFIAGTSANGIQIFAQLQAYEAFEDLVVLSKNGKRFGNKELLKGAVNTKSAEYAATTSITGDTLYFSSKGNNSKGGLDIFMSRKLPNGEWAAPINLGNKINTKYDEDFPTMMPDGKTMYFCSNGTKSMGGFDIFKTTLLPSGEWAEPQNIRYPLNDVFDNKTIAFSSDLRYAYMSKNRPDTYGFNDIYQVIFNDKDPSVKLLILKLKTGDKENNADFAKTDTTINIQTKKDKKIFGKYAYSHSNSQATIVLPPGNYNIEITGKKTEKYNLKINIPDSPGTTKMIRKTLFLKPKNNK